jgi:DNA-binding NarL/FixJ family response regulator
MTGASVVVIADGDPDGRATIAELVGRLGLESAAVDTGADALALAQIEQPALVVIAVDLSEPSGFEVCRELRERFGDQLPIVFVSSAAPEPRDEIAALLLGADDYIAKPLRADRFTARIRRLVARTEAAVPAPVPVRSSLTQREAEVIQLLVDGVRPADIAEQLCITRKTTATHLEHILGKLGAHSQAQAVAIALRSGIVQLTMAS